jgi:hypothetical protein
MSLFQTDTVFAFSFAFLFGGIAALCLAAGIVELALAHARRKDNKTIVFPSLVDIEPVVPLPISYKLRSDLGPEGELLAYLTRYTSEITPEGDIRERAQKYAPLRLGNDDDANDLSENFETLLADVKELERAAARPYTRILIHNGLTEEQLPDSKCKLQDRIERARDRLQLNSGIVSSFNKRAQDSSEEVLHETPEEPHQQLAFETV